MPKIFILLACEECYHCVFGYLKNNHTSGLSYYCIETEKKIPDIGEIAEFCELKDVKEEQ